MDKRKLKSELKNIVEIIGNYIENIEKFDEEFMTGIEDKIDELHWLLEKHCLVPDSFDPEKIISDIIFDYFNHEQEIIRIRKDINNLTDDVYNHIQEMKEGSNKCEWEKLYSNIKSAEEVINFKENEIKNIVEFIKYMKKLKSNLESLI